MLESSHFYVSLLKLFCETNLNTCSKWLLTLWKRVFTLCPAPENVKVRPSSLTCKCLSRVRVSNPCSAMCATEKSAATVSETQKKPENVHPLPAFSAAWYDFLVSHSSLNFFFCFSVSKNVLENKLTGQTSTRFPLTRAMWNDLFRHQQWKTLDPRKELDYEDMSSMSTFRLTQVLHLN